MEDLEKHIIKSIKNKKDLSSLDDNFIKKHLHSFLTKKVLQKFEKLDFNYDKFSRSKEVKQIIKEVRAKLRSIYGVFILDEFEKKEELLKNISASSKKEELKQLLFVHLSTKERFPYYEEIYNTIFSEIKNTKTILDLGCGMNPVSYPLIPNYKKLYFYSSDLSSENCKFLEKFFKKAKIKGICFEQDLIEFEKGEFHKKIKKSIDLTLLLKLVDPLESEKRHFTKKLISELNTKHLVVSFSTHSIGGKSKINKEKRSWFENFLKKQNYSYKTFSVPNEFFYIVTKRV